MPPDPTEPVPEPVQRAVASLARVPFGIALGTLVALTLFALAGWHAWIVPGEAQDLFVWLLGRNFMPGVAPTTAGAFCALGWGFAWGFAIGWVAAVARNAVVRLCVRLIVWRERLREQRHVLDDLM